MATGIPRRGSTAHPRPRGDKFSPPPPPRKLTGDNMIPPRPRRGLHPRRGPRLRVECTTSIPQFTRKISITQITRSTQHFSIKQKIKMQQIAYHRSQKNKDASVSSNQQWGERIHGTSYAVRCTPLQVAAGPRGAPDLELEVGAEQGTQDYARERRPGRLARWLGCLTSACR
jgi:hypothetical protein